MARLEVNLTNKNPRAIASHYLDTVEQLEGVPRRLRCDKGTENVVIGTLFDSSFDKITMMTSLEEKALLRAKLVEINE